MSKHPKNKKTILFLTKLFVCLLLLTNLGRKYSCKELPANPYDKRQIILKV